MSQSKRADEQPFYGWRYIKRKQPDGTEKYEEVELRQEDLLYPEQEDHPVYEWVHTRDWIYCSNALETLYTSEPNVLVLSHCRVDFGVKGIRPLGVDVLVLFDVGQWMRRGTFQLAKVGGRPVLAIEITSPGTYENDIGIKRDLYYRVGIQRYVIVDRGPKNEDSVRLIGYARTPKGWRTTRLDAQGRLSLAPVPLRLGIEDDHPWFYNATTGERLLDHAGATMGRREAEAKAREAEARAELEKRVRELEKQLRRQKRKP
jgi:hypothetical protein